MVPLCHVVIILAFGEVANAISLSQGHASLDTLETDSSDAVKDLYTDDPKALAFRSYQLEFGRNYQHGTEEYWRRRGLFEQRKAKADAHNSKPNRLWQAKAGLFADRTEAERSRMLGYKRELSSAGPSSGGAGLPPAEAAVRELLRPIQGNVTLPTNYNWTHLRKFNDVLDQGQCGSCWAVTSKAVLDAHYEIHVAGTNGPLRNFSAQQIVTCVPNPRECGGKGKCDGSTVELAFDWVLNNGLADETTVAYRAQDLNESLARCAEASALSMPSNSSGALVRDSPDGSAAPTMGGHAFNMHGWQKLTSNKEQPLLEALYQHGPVATSIGADGLFEYMGGIFNGCENNITVNHAVTLFGFGQTTAAPSPASSSSSSGEITVLEWPSPSTGPIDDILLKNQVVNYWLVRNSWGRSWGEHGFFRLERVGDGPETCGTDSDNYQGTGCVKASADGKTPADPKTVEVCGMCGFLFDSVIPVFSNSTSNATLLEQASNVHVDGSGKQDSELVRREKF